MDSKVWQRAAADLNPPGVPNSFRHAKNQQNIASVLLRREFGGSRRQKTVRAIGEDKEENFWAESESAAKTTKSTISIAISPDGKTFASTHGDHTVKIICIETGKVIQTLVGHPRTPWSVKFHPTDPRYVASGCLGFQVRFWDIETGRCLYVSTLRHAIISISFHPSGDILAIASGTCVYTWDYQHTSPRIAMFSYQTLRSVTFLPDPSKIMVGEANERYVRPQGQAPPSDLTVTLTMWDFDPSWALSPEPLLTKKAMNNSRVILSHALIYNDGGFDISRCGRYLAICADFSCGKLRKRWRWKLKMKLLRIWRVFYPLSQQHKRRLYRLKRKQLFIRRCSTYDKRKRLHSTSAASYDAVIPPDSPATATTCAPFRHAHGRSEYASSSAICSRRLILTMDQYMNQQIRRVRPRLHPPHSIHRYTAAMEPARSTAAPAAVPQQRYSQIRPNIALSRTRFTRNQRNRRGRLSSENQSTWLALISLDPEQLGRVVQTCHLAETAAGGVTSVKISPTSAYVLLGYGVRDRIQR
ncbi:WD40-repeat-containing domain [Phytophthora cactorum]|nr:WD40-repeat-containing domain [Phytophthora cactorum]